MACTLDSSRIVPHEYNRIIPDEYNNTCNDDIHLVCRADFKVNNGYFYYGSLVENSPLTLGIKFIKRIANQNELFPRRDQHQDVYNEINIRNNLLGEDVVPNDVVTTARENHVILPKDVWTNRDQNIDLNRKFYFIISDLANHGALYDHVDDLKGNEVACRNYFQHMVQGVDFLHRHNVYHLDLKIENFVIHSGNNDNNGEACAIGFGKATFQTDRMIPKRAGDENILRRYGTKLYTPPELTIQLPEGDEFDWRKTDVWALGTSLFMMLVAYPPWVDEGLVSINNPFYQIICKDGRLNEFPELNHLSDDIKDLLQRMLFADPERRISTNEILAHPWFNNNNE